MERIQSQQLKIMCHFLMFMLNQISKWFFIYHVGYLQQITMLTLFIPLFLQEQDWIRGRNPIQSVLLRPHIPLGADSFTPLTSYQIHPDLRSDWMNEIKIFSSCAPFHGAGV